MKNHCVVRFDFNCLDSDGCEILFHHSVILPFDTDAIKEFARQLAERGIYRYTVEAIDEPGSALRFIDIMTDNFV